MKIKAKIVHKYEEQSGVGKSSGMPYRRQEMKFQVLRDDFSETGESVVASCNNITLLDAPALHEGAVGILSCWMSADEYNGRCYQHVNMNGWTPQGEVSQEVAKDAAEQQSTDGEKKAENASGLPF